MLELLRREGIDDFDDAPWSPGTWPLPPRLYLDGVNIDPDPPGDFKITDTTFRDGQQAFTLYYSPMEAAALFKLLSDLDNGEGLITHSEFFLYTNRDRQVVEAVRELGLERPKVIGWGRARVEDVKLVKEAGLDEMVMLMSVSDIHIRYKFNSTRDRVASKYLEVAEYAFREGIALRCSLEDVTRSDVVGFVVPLVNRLLRLAERMRMPLVIKLPDTVGVGVPYPFASLPYSIPKLVWVLRKVAKVPGDSLEFHGHGDYHMAVANAVSAWLYGARFNNATLLGIGERAGNVPLEALVLWYIRIRGELGKLNLGVLRRVKDFFSQLGYQVPRYQPIVGDNAYSTAAGIHVDAQLKNPETYLSMDPKLLGFEPRIVIGPYSGTSGIAHWLRAKLGLAVDKDDELVRRIYSKVLQLYDEGLRREPLGEAEFMELARGVLEKQ